MGEQHYINMNTEQVSDFANNQSKDSVVMLNMVKYKAVVPETGMTGKESYKEYMRQATPFFFKGKCRNSVLRFAQAYVNWS